MQSILGIFQYFSTFPIGIFVRGADGSGIPQEFRPEMLLNIKVSSVTSNSFCCFPSLVFFNFSDRNFVRGADGSGIPQVFRHEKLPNIKVPSVNLIHFVAFHLWYFCTFPIGILSEEQTAVKFLKNSDRNS